MSTEFERLMRLAEQNTVDLQRASLERKRHIGDRSAVDGASEREMREKRRKLELEKRIKQREEDEKQRQVKLRADVERRRRERLEAEKAEEARRKSVQQQQRQAARVSAGQSSSAKGRSGVRVTPGARDTSASRRALPKEDPVSPKRPAPQRMSYEELMRIASGQAEAPAKRPAKPQPTLQQQTSLTQAGAVRATQSRQQSDQRPLRAESSKPRVEASTPRRQQPVGSTGIRHTARPLPPTARDSPAPLSPARKNTASTAVGRSAEPHERAKVPPTTKRAAGTEPVSKQREPPEPRVRKAPERELDRFGVCSVSSAKRDSARSAPPRSARVDAMPRPAGRREEQTDRRPRPRSPDSNRNQRRNPGDRNVPVGVRGGVPTNTSSRQRDRSPRRRPSPPPSARGREGARQQGHKRRGGYDDESEYDSLDDFIVDDEEEGGSRYRVGAIREMLGVRYHDVNDDDDDDMEVSTRQLMMEERRSAKLGRQEDDEEERRLEEEERARARRRRERYD
ncbi:hypothetical protein GGH94_004298 [Coemansia aciculifera]|uniref:SPT2-domain-containing protein n=1 Tax=Coemansia aciculifera TaxID=417176 RepID=A0A9W8IIE1_9FUNG|nr:hypothetical protein GGH94_004298 [Coemansia aciculifera]